MKTHDFNIAAQQFQDHLTKWYEEYKRVLPWRGKKDFYSVWVSEIMLQQTQVKTVIPYYERWLAKFPTLSALAEADESEVLKQWEGLGYYRRARFLHKGAAFVIQKGIPENYEELLKVPGIGPYTAGAIASIVNQEAVPAIDGNVLRVISRTRAIFDPIDTKIGQEAVRKFVVASMDSESPGDFNQALMELGALICKPKKADCDQCPVLSDCASFGQFEPTLLPIKSRKVKVKKWAPFATIYLNKNNEIALTQENEKGLLEGLWGVPLSDSLPELARLIAIVPHKFSHRDTHYQVCVSEEKTAHRYFNKIQMEKVPISTAMKKVIAAFFASQ